MENKKFSTNPYAPLIVWVAYVFVATLGGAIGLVYFYSWFPSVNPAIAALIYLILIFCLTPFVKKPLVRWRIENELFEEIELADAKIKILKSLRDENSKDEK